MQIPYKLVIGLLSKKLTVHTLKEFKEINSEELSASLTTAHLIEDYDYLSVMTHEGNVYDDYVVVYFPNVAQYPIVLKKDAPLDLFALARLYFDLKKHFTIEDFFQIIETEAHWQTMEPTSLYLQFNIYLNKIDSIDKLERGSVGRNDHMPMW